MKKLTERELERLLAADAGGEPSPEPPAGLAERIKAEIPEDLPRPGIEFEDLEAPARPVWSAHPWRLAAVLAMTLGGGSLAWWAWQGAPRLQPETPLDRVSAPAAVSTAESAPAEGPREPKELLADRDAAMALEESRDELAERLGGSLADPRSARREAFQEEAAQAQARNELRQELRSLGHAGSRAAKAEGEAQASAGTLQAVPPPPAPPVTSAPRSQDDERAAAGRQSVAQLRLRQKKVPLPDPTPDDKPARLEEEARARDPYSFAEELVIVGDEPEVDSSASTSGVEVKRELNKPKLAAPGMATEPPVPTSAAPSTGGSEEPNDQAFGDVFFEHAGVNPFLDTEEDPLSTFGLDVDTGSWGVVRRYLEDGHLPPKSAVRVEEIVNALDYGDPAPRRGDFALTAEGAPSPFAAGDRYRLLRFAVKAREIREGDRKPAALTFVVDVSGSMAREERLGLVKRSLRMLVERLSPADRLGLVIYGSRGEVVLEATSDHGAILAAIDRLVPTGATNAEEGLVLGYQVASRALRPGAINRVILCSDGVANVGATGPDSILERVQREAARGIELTTLGFGMGNYNDVLMERLADAGDGRYAYLDSIDEARRILVEQLTGTLETVAGEARAQVELNPEVVERYRLLGYENRDIADERFRDDTVDAGEIGAGHTVTALYEVKLREGLEAPAGARAFRNEPVATLRLRWRSVAAGKFVESEKVLRVGDLEGSWDDASPALRLASLAAETAEILRGSYWARGGSLDDVFRRLQRLGPELAGNRQAAELTALAGRAAGLAAAAGEPGPEGADE